MPSSLNDTELLVGSRVDPELFGEFYQRHLPIVTRYLLARTKNPETAADMTAEVFAAALAARERYEPQHGTALPWLLTIAKRIFIDSVRRGAVADEARRGMKLQPLIINDGDLERVEEIADSAAAAPGVLAALGDLDDETRELLIARVVDERSYDELAVELDCSAQVIRKRVSRGLAQVRASLGGKS